MVKDVCVEFGERIRQLRKERGWRQIDFAEEAGSIGNISLAVM